MAASQCPKCGHAFEVRDGFGELLPLSHCSSCDSYYPQSAGSCRWCGTKPERAPVTPYIWKGVGVLTFVAMAIGAWLVHDDAPPSSSKPARTFVADTLPTNQPKAESFGGHKTLARGDSADPLARDTALAAALAVVSRDVAAAPTQDTTMPESTSVVSAEPVPVQSAGTVAQPESLATDSVPAPEPTSPVVAPRTAAPAPDRASTKVAERRTVHAPEGAIRAPEKTPSRKLARTPSHATPRTSARPTTRGVVRPPASVAKTPSRSVAKAPTRAVTKTPARVTAKTPPRVTPPPKSTPSTPSRAGWITSVARNWAVVRADPSHQGRIIAAIGPNTRVQLGETRGAWRRIKAKGLAGWVEHRSLLADVPPPTRSGRLAAQ